MENKSWSCYKGLKHKTVLAQMELDEFVDCLLKKYGDRSQYPDDPEELQRLIDVFAKTKQALIAENTMLKQLAFHADIRKEFKKKTKK